MAALADATPPERINTAVGRYGQFQGLGQILAPLTGGIGADIDWRWAFVSVAIVSALLTMFAPDGQPRPDASWPPIGPLLSTKQLLLGAATASAALGFVGLSVLMGAQIRDELGYGGSSAGLILMAGGLAALLTSGAWGRFAGRWSRHRRPRLRRLGAPDHDPLGRNRGSHRPDAGRDTRSGCHRPARQQGRYLVSGLGLSLPESRHRPLGVASAARHEPTDGLHRSRIFGPCDGPRIRQAPNRRSKRANMTPVTSPTDTELTPAELVDLYTEELYHRRNLDAINELVADPMVRHESDGQRLVLTSEQTRERIAAFHQQFRSMRFSTRLAVQDASTVATAYEADLVDHDGNVHTISGIEIFTISRGKITEVWNGPAGDGAWG
jgi:hypothetical protein